MPILQKQFPEIVDFYLPPEGCSYRMAIVSIKKSYPGHAKRRDVRRLELPAPVHVHQVHRRHRRRRRHPRLARRDLGDHDADGPGARHRAGRPDADRLPRLRVAGRAAWAARWDSTRPTSGRGETEREWGRPIRHDPAVDGAGRERDRRDRGGAAAIARCPVGVAGADADAACRASPRPASSAGAASPRTWRTPPPSAAPRPASAPSAARASSRACSPSDMPISTPLTSAA